jgi:hypothetical protein
LSILLSKMTRDEATSLPCSSDKRSRTGWRGKLFVLLLVFIAGDQLFSIVGKLCLYSPWATSGDITISEDIFWINGPKPDVVFLGDSRVGSGLKPLTVDNQISTGGTLITSVNIWMAAAGPGEYRKIIRHLLADNKPRLILCDINENALHQSSPEQDIPRTAGVWHSAQYLIDLYGEGFDWQLRHLSGTLHWGVFVQRAIYNAVSDVGRVMFYDDKISSGSLGRSKGYRINSGHERKIKLALQRDRDARAYQSLQVTEASSKRFREFLSAVRDSDLRMVIFLAPVAPELLGLFPPPRYHAFLRFLKETTAYYGIPFVNYYQNPHLPPEAFFDSHHLNDRGAEAFSRQIASEIIDPALKDWQRFKDAVITKKD